MREMSVGAGDSESVAHEPAPTSDISKELFNHDPKTAPYEAGLTDGDDLSEEELMSMFENDVHRGSLIFQTELMETVDNLMGILEEIERGGVSKLPAEYVKAFGERRSISREMNLFISMASTLFMGEPYHVPDLKGINKSIGALLRDAEEISEGRARSMKVIDEINGLFADTMNRILHKTGLIRLYVARMEHGLMDSESTPGYEVAEKKRL